MTDLPFLTPLNADQLRAAGIPEPWRFGMADQVRFGEIDALQHVNNAVYLKWFENLRILYFQQFSLWHQRENRPKFVLRAVDLDYRSEVKLTDRYILTGRTMKMGTSSFTMEYGVWVGDRLTTTSHAVLVMLNPDNTKAALPESLRTELREIDGVPD
ncbi:acyl-CoA thioester hydrolase [Loktanella sp. DSM 29012]|uniref:acyl-CoA thioesterase n=1 Tax=Loktanella sp. DSM 29012 TaxID=1881056 RepID=UPI0008B00B9D|nr:thioesterase family protein [Loktanella sp. DSM 29012]SEP91717.1 acyl-CoA thioester hydrolase [Loktanella sp. DSM 29012]